MLGKHVLQKWAGKVDIRTVFKRCTFAVTAGIADEGFEMLDQLAYLYLANNKVSHAVDSEKCFFCENK